MSPNQSPAAPAAPATQQQLEDQRLQHALALAKDPVAISHLLQDNEGLRTILGTLLLRANNVLILKVNQRRAYFDQIEKKGLVPSFEILQFGKKGDLQILAHWNRPNFAATPAPTAVTPAPDAPSAEAPGICTDCGADPAHPRSEPLPEGAINEKAESAPEVPQGAEDEAPVAPIEGTEVPQMKVGDNEL
jgi:hypothetical protein